MADIARASGYMMHQTADEDVKQYCYRHAEECARRAASQTNVRFREDFLELQRRWLRLARETERATLPLHQA